MLPGGSPLTAPLVSGTPSELRRPHGPEFRLSGGSCPRWALVFAKLATLPLLVLLVNLAASVPLTADVAAASLSLSADANTTISLAEVHVKESESDVQEAETDVKDWKRWLWWPLILYLFWGMAFTCDEYFVRTIDVISERFEIPDDVAGATLMALGCNGPELSLNLIGIFHESDIGIGAVIGGEVFNVLVIIGTALLATPLSYMPLKIGKFTFGRDVFFYAFSVALLWYVLHDGYVSRLESMLLLCGAALYIATVIMSSKLRTWLKSPPIRRATRSVSTLVRQVSLPRMLGTFVDDGKDIDDSSSESSEDDPEMEALWEKGLKSLDPVEGSVMGVRLDTRNRMMDRNHHYDQRFLCLGENALVLSTAKAPRQHQCGHATLGLVFDYRATAQRSHQWHHGGLVSEPVYLPKTGSPLDAPGVASDSTNIKTQPSFDWSATFLESEHFQDLAVEVIPLQDILYVERGRDHKQFTLHVQHRDDIGGVSTGVATLDFRSDVECMTDAWTQALMEKLINQRRRTAEPPPEKHGAGLIMQWVEWLQFPVKFWLHMTVPDMDRPDRQHLYPVSFVMSMVWLALFAFSVIAACDGIHADFGISTKILGFTVAAAGTSFPNVFSGMVVARQGKTTMAVANALGANVQNVFLALAIPWAVKAFLITKGAFQLQVDDLNAPIMWCYITLLPVVGVYAAYSGKMPRWSGALYLVVYFIYLIVTLTSN